MKFPNKQLYLICRGGSWFDVIRPNEFIHSFRFGQWAHSSFESIGFRIVCNGSVG